MGVRGGLGRGRGVNGVRGAWRAGVLAVVCAVLLPVAPRAQEMVIVVRHAERLDQSSDSVLSAAGETRAAHLATMLRDGGITHIFTTDRRRTIQTAAPLATTLGLTPVQLPSGDVDGLVARLRAAGARDRILVVGHSNTLPTILAQLGVATPITIADLEYDNLFVLTPRPGAPAPLLLRLRFD